MLPRARTAVLMGPQRAAALSMVDEIIDALLPFSASCTSASRLAEMALLFATSAERRALELDWSQLLQRALNATAATPLLPDLGGSLGFALTLQHALALRGSADDVCSAFDALLESAVMQAAPGPFDHLSGIAGQVMYLLERPLTAVTERTRRALLGQLASQARRDAHGVFWQREGAKRDLGFAHGAAGVIAALARVVEKGWGGAREVGLLTGAVDWLLAHEAAGPDGFRYPGFVGERFCRLAWCYCDLGIAVALDSAAGVLHRSDWSVEAGRIAHGMLGLPMEQSGVIDASLCHGAVGVGLLMSSLGNRFDSQPLREASAAWYLRANDLRRPTGRFAGFQFARIEEWEDNPSLLEGAVGIALGLEAACTATPQEWPRYVFGLRDA